MKTRTTRRTIATASLGLLVLAGCSAPAGDSNGAVEEAEQSTADPSEGLDSEAGLTVEPGFASCEFDSEVTSEAGPADYSGATLQTAELRETEDAYEVAMTGEFFDPEQLMSDQTNVSFTVELLTEEVDEVAELETAYEAGEVTFSGVRTTSADVEQETNVEITDGAFNATYPQDVAELTELQPTQWLVRVEFDEGITDEANPDDSDRPVTFRCGDGSPLTWEPAEG